jgi:hypothetical protein
MKKVSLASLAVDAPVTAGSPRAQPKGRIIKLTRLTDNKLTRKLDRSEPRVQVAFRMGKAAYRDLKRMALDEDTTVNELLLRAIDELRERRGLK